MHNINVYLVRHGQSTGNNVGLIGQNFDTDLTDLGKEQAKKLGERFKREGVQFDRAFSSSYKRAADTARIIVDTIDHKEPLYFTEALVEYSAGDWKGKKIEEVFGDITKIGPMLSRNMEFVFPNGDSLVQVERRASDWLEKNISYNDAIRALAEKRDVNLLVVSHGHTIRCLLHYIMGFSSEMFWKMIVYNTAISWVYYNERGWHFKTFNDTAHL